MFPPVFLKALLLLMSTKLCTNKSLMCDSKADCQDGYSCIENICKVCVECSLIFRKGNSCENDFNNCGDCLEGYEEISVTHNSAIKKPCKPRMKNMNLKECANDNNCPPDNYCSEKLCVNCFDCSLINRLKPERCARDPNECGPCFIGYLSIPSKSRRNYNKCVEVPPDPKPINIASGSVLTAFIFLIVIAVLVVRYKIKDIIDLGSSKSTDALQCQPSAPPFELMYESQTVKSYELENTDDTTEQCTHTYETQEVQQTKVYKWPCASYYPKHDGRNEEISEPDSGSTENSNVLDQRTSGQTGETMFSQGSVIFGECGRSRSLSEVNSINPDSGSQDEQPVDVNVLNNESAENNSHLATDDPAQVPEDPAKQPTEDSPLGQR